MKKEYSKPVVICTDMERETNPLKKYRTNPDFIYREIAEESILVPSGEMATQFNGLASLNRTGAFLWKLMEQEKSLPELVRAFADEYELTEKQSTEDVTEFLNIALDKKLVLRN